MAWCSYGFLYDGKTKEFRNLRTQGAWNPGTWVRDPQQLRKAQAPKSSRIQERMNPGAPGSKSPGNQDSKNPRAQVVGSLDARLVGRFNG